MFKGCKELREIEIPMSVEEIGESRFYECSPLSRVTFAGGSALKHIGREAFLMCDMLRGIDIPARVQVDGPLGVISL